MFDGKAPTRARWLNKSVVTALCMVAVFAVLGVIDSFRDRSAPPKYVIIQNPELFVFVAFWVGWIGVNSADKILRLKLQERDSNLPFYVALALGVATYIAAWAGLFTGYPPPHEIL
jgi:hypothetical protein